MQKSCAIIKSTFVTASSYRTLTFKGDEIHAKHGFNTDWFATTFGFFLAIGVLHKTPVQILLRFLTQKDIAVIPRSTQPEHIKENFDLFDFSLTADEIAQPSCYSV